MNSVVQEADEKAQAAAARRQRPPVNRPTQLADSQRPISAEELLANYYWPVKGALPVINKDVFRQVVWEHLDSANLVRFPRFENSSAKNHNHTFTGRARGGYRIFTVTTGPPIASRKPKSTSRRERSKLTPPWLKKKFDTSHCGIGKCFTCLVRVHRFLYETTIL